MRVRRIFHPSDFSEASAIAFAHALKMAVVAQAELDILHVTVGSEVPWAAFPGVRETLEQWRLIAPGSGRDVVGRIGMNVRKVVARGADPVEAVLDYLRDHPTDLIVLATHNREGKASWLQRSVAQPIARGSRQMTLFIPERAEGFVSFVDGSVNLRNIVIPVDAVPDPLEAVDAACAVAWALQAPEVKFTVLHVGPHETMPRVIPEAQPGWTWEFVARQGQVVDTILGVAAERSADLVVMATAGRGGFLDALRGSTTERVLGAIRCPLMAYPARTA